MAYQPEYVPQSVIGSVQLLNSSAIIGSVATLQGTNPWRTLGSVSGTIDIGVSSGSVLSQQLGTRISSVINSTPSSLLTGASIFGMLPAGTQVLGSVTALQGTNPWITTFSNPSIFAIQSGTQISSVINSIPSSLLTGGYGHRNDNVASYLGGNLTWNQLATDSAGRTLSKPFAAEEARIEGYHSVVSTSVTTLVAAAGAGLRNYVTDFFVVNSGGITTPITWQDGLGSVLGYTIAPAYGGSNATNIATPIRTGVNASFDFKPTASSSIIYVTVKGFKAP